MQHDDGDGNDDVPHPADAEPDNVVPIERARRKRSPYTPLEIDLIQRHAQPYAGTEIRYCGPLGGWFSWSGACWARDEREHAREVAKQVARSIAHEAAARNDDDLWRVARRAGSAGGIGAVLDVLRSAPGVVFVPADADQDPFALACANGTIDLRTGQLRPHARAELITRASSVVYDPQATAPRFVRFLKEVQPDQDVRAYLARLIGYSAVGVVQEQVLGVFWGPGANGKSVLADIVTYALGDYARPGPSSLIVSTGHSQPHPTDVASCAGSRLVIVHETQRGANFDTSKVKLLTGADTLTARHMHQNYFTFAPTHTLVMLSNYRPSADSSDYAFWRRVHLVPFDVVIPEESRDPKLGEALRAEAPGVLRWIVDGALEWQRDGLAPPKVVREQTEQYRASEDVIGQFIEERCVKLKEASARGGDLYAAYRVWCQQTALRPVRNNDFAGELRARGFTKDEKNFGAVYRGIGLLSEEKEP